MTKPNTSSVTLTKKGDLYSLQAGGTNFSTENIQDLARVMAGLKINYNIIEDSIALVGSGMQPSVTINMTAVIGSGGSIR